MLFIVRKTPLQGVVLKAAKKDIIQLRPDNWDDYSFQTSFMAILYPAHNSNKSIELGPVKIIKINQKSKTSTWELLKHDKLTNFHELSDEYCSLGQSEEYYFNLQNLRTNFYHEYLSAMKDIYFDPTIGHKFENEKNPALETSLLRKSSAAILYEPHSLKKSQTPWAFSTEIYLGSSNRPHQLSVDFTPHGELPNRTFVLVGKNGVGKTQLLARLAFLVSGGAQSTSANKKTIQKKDSISHRGLFRNVIAISFSAFDNFEIPQKSAESNISYRYWGLRDGERHHLSTEQLLDRVCDEMFNQTSEKKEIFDKYLKYVAPEITFSDLISTNKGIKKNLKEKTSAGQRIMISVIAGLVNSLENKSLLLFDEPETHLHPSRLATLLSIINNLLEEFDSYAILSTHSPIVLQQVPSRYVRVIRRLENTPFIDPSPIETFGENLTEISQRVFDVNDYERDYKDVFIELLQKNNYNADAIDLLFDKHLGVSARTLLYSLAKGHKS